MRLPKTMTVEQKRRKALDMIVKQATKKTNDFTIGVEARSQAIAIKVLSLAIIELQEQVRILQEQVSEHDTFINYNRPFNM